MNQDDITQIHETVLKFLLKWKIKHRDLTFTLRKSDFSKRLTNGYWFHGNDHYISISFWTGMDWQSKVPNISFVIIPIRGECFLQFSAKDSEEKNDLIHTLFYDKFHLNEINRSFYTAPVKSAESGQYLMQLEDFLKNEKPFIDNVIQLNKKLFETKQNPKNRIGLISESEFQKSYNKTKKFRTQKIKINIPIGLASIQIKNYGYIKKSLHITDIPTNTQWIFFTGENGTGKTTILRALATALTNGSTGLGPRNGPQGNYDIELRLNKNNRVAKHIIKKTTSSKEIKILSKGFVAFGPVRLNIQDQNFLVAGKQSTLKHIFSKPHIQLFSTINPLVDIGYVYNRDQAISRDLKNDQEKLRYIIEAITTICDSIIDIHFGRSMRYFETDKNQKLLSNNGSSFQQLASGYKSIIGMVSHMMLHLYHQQPEINDPAELEGIVIIDEIDLHFHPKMQRDLVIKLSEIFPRIQFIASTHSPIPLLGVSGGTPIYTVKIDSENGVFAERMDEEVDIKNLLPNSILTSPIFGFQEIYSEDKNPDTFVRAETTFDEVKESDIQAKRIGKYLNKKNTLELLKFLKNS